MAHAKERFASFLKKELGLFLMRSFQHDPAVFLSVVDVVLDDSSENAKVHVSIFPSGTSAPLLRDLKNAGGEARHYLSSRLKRRRIPKISFLLIDNAKGERLEKLLEKVKNG